MGVSGIAPWGYSEGAVEKCDTTPPAAYLSKESGRRRPDCHLCRAHMLKMAASSAGAYHGCNLALALGALEV